MEQDYATLLATFTKWEKRISLELCMLKLLFLLLVHSSVENMISTTAAHPHAHTVYLRVAENLKIGETKDRILKYSFQWHLIEWHSKAWHLFCTKFNNLHYNAERGSFA